MSATGSDDQLLLIRCPSCGQRFKVSGELLGSMVECGECDHQFEITDAVVVRGRKFYPGERKDPLLEHVHRVDRPLPAVSNTDAYEAQAGSNPAEPVSPGQLLMGVGGLFVMVIAAMILIFGSARGGVLDGVTMDKRLILAVFFGLLGGILLILATPKQRVLGILAAVTLAAGVISLPFVYQGGSSARETDPVASAEAVASPVGGDVNVPAEEELDMREVIGTGPLEVEIRRLAEAGSQMGAIGVWLRNLQFRNCLIVRDYIIRKTDADLQSHDYPRGDGAYLMVVTGIDETLEEMATIVSSFGEVRGIYPDLRVVEVHVDNRKFLSGPMDQMTDSGDPDFYLLNQIELNSIDLDRVSASVKRLSEARPSLFRDDITNRLIQLLSDPWVDFKPAVCRALLVWAEDPGPAAKAALEEVKRLRVINAVVPEDMISLILKARDPDIVPVLHALWMESPMAWEKYYIEAGSMAEWAMVRELPETTGTYRQSAVRILGRIGRIDSLPALKAMSKMDLDSETRILTEKAIELVRKRLDF